MNRERAERRNQLAAYAAAARREQDAKKVGFWRPHPAVASHYDASDPEMSLPWPGDLIDPSFDPRLRAMVAAYLLEPKFKGTRYKGTSRCRLCGKMNGSADYSDGTYTWPQGYAHYVRDHGVRPPQDLVEHIRKQGYDDRFVERPGMYPASVAALQVDAGEPKIAAVTLQTSGLLGPHTNFDAAKKYGEAKRELAYEIDFRQCFGEPIPGAMVAALARMKHAQEGALDGKMDHDCLVKEAERITGFVRRACDASNKHSIESWKLMQSNPPQFRPAAPKRCEIVGPVVVAPDWQPADYEKLRVFVLANYGKKIRDAAHKKLWSENFKGV
jgi:hypothetical protein